MSKSNNRKNVKNGRKQLSAAARKEKNAVERLRRFLEKNLTEAKKNGWSLKDSMWFGQGSACLFGMVLANKEHAGPGQYKMLKEKYQKDDSEVHQASIASGVDEDVVSDVIGGFDDYRPFKLDTSFKEYSFPMSKREQYSSYIYEYVHGGPFFRLGWRLAKKHLGKSV